MIGFDPTDEQRLIAETVRQFAEKEIRPHARPSDEAGCLALIEPRYDFDPLQPATQARRDGDDYVISGEKCFVPWLAGESQGAGAMLVVASEQDEPQAFLVPRGSAGLEATPEENMGIRGLPTVELGFDAVRIPVGARLGGDRGSDLRPLVNRGRVAIAAAAVGMARAAFEQLIVARRILDYSSAMLR